MTTKIDLNAARFFVFLSKDETEYDRYSNRDLLSIVNGLVRGKYLVRENGNVVVVLSPEVKSSDEMFHVCNNVSAAILSIAGAQSKIRESLKILNAPDKTKMFVHWGGDGWRDRERSARLELQGFEAYSNWTVSALSTQRPELWDIGKITIRLPETDEDFARLSEFSLWDELKNVLTRCVFEWRANMADSSAAIDESANAVLRNYVEQLKKHGFRGRFSDDDSKWMSKALDRLYKQLHRKRAGNIPLTEQTVALFSKLVREGIDHG